jgi:hypothetical protein
VSAALPGEPGAQLTSIEYPYGLYLAPTVSTASANQVGFTTTFVGRGEPVVGSNTMPTGEVTDLWTVSLQQETRPAGKGLDARGASTGKPDAKGGSGVVEPLTPQMVAVGLRAGHATGEPGTKRFRIKYHKAAAALLALARDRRRGRSQP